MTNPICPIHKVEMRPSKYPGGGFYCGKKVEDGSYCKEKIAGTPSVETQPTPKSTSPSPSGLVPVIIEKEPTPQDYREAAKQLSIIREACLKAAVALVAPFIGLGKVADSNMAADVAQKLAERFEAWVKRG